MPLKVRLKNSSLELMPKGEHTFTIFSPMAGARSYCSELAAGMSSSKKVAILKASASTSC